MLLFPAFWGLGQLANPGLTEAAKANPVRVEGSACSTDPFAELFSREQSNCGKILETLTSAGVSYTLTDASELSLSAGDNPISIDPAWMEDGAARSSGIRDTLAEYGYDFAKQQPDMVSILGIVAILLVLGALSALTYGSVAALLSEMFPAKIRYSSMSIPYHIGAGYLGGFLPLIAGYIVARSGDIYAGLWYTWVVVAFGVVVAWWGIPNDPEAALDEAP